MSTTNVMSSSYRPPYAREGANESSRRRPRSRSRSRGARESTVTEARPRRRSYAMEEMAGGGDMAITTLTAGGGFVAFDVLDRFLASYDPSAATKPTDKFTSDGSGAMANTLNIASMPSPTRWAAAILPTAATAFASMGAEDETARAVLEGITIGGGINIIKLLWSNVVMPLLAPSDTSTPSLQKSIVCRLYPAEVAAAINSSAKPPQHAVSSGGGAGALSGAPYPQLPMGVGDPGPFALSGSSPYDDASQALSKAAGLLHDSPAYASAHDVLQRAVGVGGDSPYASSSDALRLGLAEAANVVAATVPNVNPVDAHVAAASAVARPHDLLGSLTVTLPHVPLHMIMAAAQALAPLVSKLAPVVAATQPAPTTGTGQPPAYMPGPPPGPGPGPQFGDHQHGEGCGCGDGSLAGNAYVGALGDEAPANDIPPLWAPSMVLAKVGRIAAR